jgi:nucleotide-binding universal stress UspA family protein
MSGECAGVKLWVSYQGDKVFQKVLVGVDGKSNGRDAIALACQLLDHDGELTLAHVHGSELMPSPSMGIEQRERSQHLLEHERSLAGCEARLESRSASSVGRGLHELAEQIGADLLVVGSCSRGFAGRVFVGNAARGALTGAPCAVATAPLGYAERAPEIATVGVGYDGSPESEAALAAARALASARGVTVRALQAVSIPAFAYPGYVPPEIGETIDAMLAAAQERLDALEGVEGAAVYGLAGEELVEFGKQVDLLVVGSRGYGPVSRLILGSTAEYLQRNAPCPLLVLSRSALAQEPTSKEPVRGSLPVGAVEPVPQPAAESAVAP